eukprot:scaffold1351_cov359-Prasinococcus_capsulatus_cf.AAC.1
MHSHAEPNHRKGGHAGGSCAWACRQRPSRSPIASRTADFRAFLATSLGLHSPVLSQPSAIVPGSSFCFTNCVCERYFSPRLSRERGAPTQSDGGLPADMIGTGGMARQCRPALRRPEQSTTGPYCPTARTWLGVLPSDALGCVDVRPNNLPASCSWPVLGAGCDSQ